MKIDEIVTEILEFCKINVERFKAPSGLRRAEKLSSNIREARHDVNAFISK